MKEITTSKNNNMPSQDSNLSAEKTREKEEEYPAEGLPGNRRGRKSSRNSCHPLREIRLARGFTLEELAELSNLSPSYLSRLESRARRLNVDTIDRLSLALQCNPGDLLMTSDRWIQTQTGIYPASLSQDSEKGHLKTYLLSFPYKVTKISVYSLTANNDKIDFSSPIGFISCPPDLMNAPGSFALKIENNIMAPRYRTGDVVLVHPGRPLNSGSTAVVIMNNFEVILGEFVAWHSKAESENKDQLSDSQIKDQYTLELKQYQTPQANFNTSRVLINKNIMLQPHNILTIARIIGTLEE